MPNFDVIIVTKNDVKELKKTLASVISSGAHDSCNRVIISDRHSTDKDMRHFLEVVQKYKDVYLIQSPKDDGFASAFNDAIGISRSENILLIMCGQTLRFREHVGMVLDSYIRGQSMVHGRGENIVLMFLRKSDMAAVGAMIEDHTYLTWSDQEVVRRYHNMFEEQTK